MDDLFVPKTDMGHKPSHHGTPRNWVPIGDRSRIGHSRPCFGDVEHPKHVGTALCVLTTQPSCQVGNSSLCEWTFVTSSQAPHPSAWNLCAATLYLYSLTRNGAEVRRSNPRAATRASSKQLSFVQVAAKDSVKEIGYTCKTRS